MKNFHPNVPFNSLSAETVCNLCAFAMQHMTAEVATTPEVSEVLSLDVSIPAAVRLNTHNADRFWQSYKDNKNAVLALLSMYVEVKRTNTTRYVHLSERDASPEVLLDPEVISFVLQNRENLHFHRMSDYNSLYACVKAGQFYEFFKQHPALAATFAANWTGILTRMQAHRGIMQSEKMDFYNTVIGFLHKWDNDSPRVLTGLVSEGEGISKDDLDVLMSRICSLCRKDEENMKRIKSDLANDSIGGKATRHRDAGWLTVYMHGLWEQGKIVLAKQLVQDVPPLMGLLPAKARANKEFRSLKRLYQISGDYGA